MNIYFTNFHLLEKSNCQLLAAVSAPSSRAVQPGEFFHDHVGLRDMDVDSYVNEDEVIRCRSPTTDTEESVAGIVAVTDSRLIQIKATDSLLDTLTIDLADIDDVEYEVEPVKWVVVALGGAIAASGILWHLFSPLAGDLPFVAFTLITGVLILFGAVVAFDGFNTRTETLRVHSNGEEYVFQGGSFSTFPDAIDER